MALTTVPPQSNSVANRRSLTRLERLDRSLEADINRASIIESEKLEADRVQSEKMRGKLHHCISSIADFDAYFPLDGPFIRPQPPKRDLSSASKTSAKKSTTATAGTNTKSLNSIGGSDESATESISDLQTER